MAGVVEGYAPGWTGDAVAMMSARSASERAGFVLAELDPATVVLDVGCGPGSISLGLADVVAPTGRVVGIDAQASQVQAAAEDARRSGAGNAQFVVASAYALPVREHSVDVYFSHALFEHLSRPWDALGQARRVLRDGGLLAVAASDWSRAEFDPYTDDVAVAMSGHYELRRRAGGDPFAGGRLVAQAAEAGFTVMTHGSEHRVDLGYRELADYVALRLSSALRNDPNDRMLATAQEAALRWQRTEGVIRQCWTHVLACAPVTADHVAGAPRRSW